MRRNNTKNNIILRRELKPVRLTKFDLKLTFLRRLRRLTLNFEVKRLKIAAFSVNFWLDFIDDCDEIHA